MSVKTAMLRCPWCKGSRIELDSEMWDGKIDYFVKCLGQRCTAAGPSRRTASAAIAAWNDRALDERRGGE